MIMNMEKTPWPTSWQNYVHSLPLGGKYPLAIRAKRVDEIHHVYIETYIRSSYAEQARPDFSITIHTYGTVFELHYYLFERQI